MYQRSEFMILLNSNHLQNISGGNVFNWLSYYLFFSSLPLAEYRIINLYENKNPPYIFDAFLSYNHYKPIN